MKLDSQTLRTVLAVLPLSLVAATAAAAGPGDGEFELHRALLRAGRVELQVSSPALAAHALRHLPPGSPFAFTVGTPSHDAGREARIVVATRTDTIAKELARKVRVEVVPERGFQAFGREYVGAGDALRVVLPDPDRPGLPLTLWLGNSEEALLELATDFAPDWRAHVTIWSSGELDLEAGLDQDGRLAEEPREYRTARARRRNVSTRFEKSGLVLHLPAGYDAARLVEYAQSLRAAFNAAVELVGASPTRVPEIEIYSSVAGCEHITGRAGLAHASVLSNRVHAVVAPGLPDDAGATVARAIALNVGGPPAQAWMVDGLAVRAAGSWWGRPLERWVARLSEAGVLPALDQLLARDAEQLLGEHVVLPLRGFLMGHLAATTGLPAVRALWRDPARRLPADLANTFAAALEENHARFAAELAAADEARRAEALADPFRGGVALVEAAHDTRRGYGSLSAEQALAHAAKKGAQAVSLTVFAYADARPRLQPGAHARGLGASVDDAALASVVAAAHSHGLRVLLTPHHLPSAHATWADSQALTTLPERERFFAQHERILLHYALLGELLGIELLSVGTELRVASSAGANAVDEEEQDRTAAELRGAWLALIEHLRGAFGGALLYDADWPVEARSIEFWSALDAVGIHEFLSFPGVDGAPPDDRRVVAQLMFNLSAAVEFADQLGKPLIVTQIGFPSCAAGWRDTGTLRGKRDVAEQKRFFACLSVVMKRLRERGAAPAFFVWCFTSDAAALGRFDRSHALQGKPAEELLPELFGAQ